MRQLQLSKRPDVYGGKTTAEWLEFLQSLPNPFPAEISAERQAHLLRLFVSIVKQYLAQEPDMEKLVRGGYEGLVKCKENYMGQLIEYEKCVSFWIRQAIISVVVVSANE